uniref:Uncharacterized protein n=1 Tax=Myoviridae sp. ctCo31 TaxID=2825053 RepID=A0A8S5UMR8_9CAUD|nr:MAG TPA: hypothetical protein [Myoviridae sp. ctCo31]
MLFLITNLAKIHAISYNQHTVLNCLHTLQQQHV